MITTNQASLDASMTRPMLAQKNVAIVGATGMVGGYALPYALDNSEVKSVTSIGRKEKVDVVFDLVGGDAQKRSFLVLKEGGHLVSAVQPVSQEESALHQVSGEMMRLAPSGDVLSRIGRLLEKGQYDQTWRPCTHSKIQPRPGRTAPRNRQGFMGCRPVGRERQDERNTARSCFVWPSGVTWEIESWSAS
jgi:NADPH:quinone reductase-like Zn-dependent oxidoreductase